MNSDDQRLKRLRILAVDDDETTLLLLQRILERDGYVDVEISTDPMSVQRKFLDRRPDLVLLDLHMPQMGGLELMQRLGALSGGGSGVAFVILTADTTDGTRHQALALGARDFLTKPIDRIELLLRVRNLLQVRLLQDRLGDHNAQLEAKVAERTHDLDQARQEILERLALVGEFRDDATQKHAQRIGRLCARLVLALGLPRSEMELIERAATLHDLGKVGISDAILLKPASLTESEFSVIKTHPGIGAEILAGSRSPLLRLAEEVARTHHERWDGGGYPVGLHGDEIPLAGRIVAVADVFDTLTHERPYKPAWSVDDAVDEIERQAGLQFDPEVVDAFSALDHSTLVS